MRLRLLALALLALAAACHRAARPPVTRPEDALLPPHGKVALRDDADLAGLTAAVRESLAWLSTQPPGRALVFGPRTATVHQLRAALESLAAALTPGLDARALEARVREHFDVVEAAGGEDGQVLFTGYFEPVLEASLTPSPTYATPLYARPPELLEVPLTLFADKYKGERLFARLDGARVLPYWTRAEIATGKLGGRGLELAWARDPVALFFLEVQGSGVLKLPDGSERRVGYAASNGRPYQSIGGLLIREGALTREQVSMQTIRGWLAAHPEHQQRVLHFNESYVFFRFLEGAALGFLNRPVTPGRSIATDSRLFPPGALAFVQTDHPVAGPDGAVAWKPLNRFVLNQDTGGAIRGAGRVDVFWGRGPEAELAAGLMKQKGRLFFLVPRAAATTVAAGR